MVLMRNSIVVKASVVKLSVFELYTLYSKKIDLYLSCGGI